MPHIQIQTPIYIYLENSQAHLPIFQSPLPLA